MAQKPTIPSQYLPQPCGTSPRLTVFTNSTNPLYLIFTDEQPKRKPRFKTIRGLTYECGRQWHLPNAICIPQMNLPTQKYHIFPLPTRAIGTCVWYAISNACQAAEATSFSPPIQYCYVACPPGGQFCIMQEILPTLLGGSYGLAYNNVVAGNAAVRVNDLTMKMLSAGSIVTQATAVVRADPNAPGTWTGEMYFEGNSYGEFGHAGPFTTDQGQEITISAVGEAFLPANELVTVNVRQTGGTNLLQTPGSLNATSQWSIGPA